MRETFKEGSYRKIPIIAKFIVDDEDNYTMDFMYSKYWILIPIYDLMLFIDSEIRQLDTLPVKIYFNVDEVNLEE